MSTAAPPASPPEAPVPAPRPRDWRRTFDRFGDLLLIAICAGAALLAVAALLAIGYQVVHGAAPSISKFGLGFVFHTNWQPNPPF
jgi:ABC-type phosphate transport system permease subunit